MSQTGARFVWRIAGAGREYPPPGDYGTGTRCYLCAGVTDGVGWPRADAIPETFTGIDRPRYPVSSTVCQACAALAHKATWEDYVEAHPAAGLKTGHAVSWRFYSHAAWGNHHECPSRDRWRDLLLDPPEPPFVYVMAISAQKHLLWSARVAESRTEYPLVVEEATVIVRREAMTAALVAFEALLTLGHTRDDVLSGRYASHRALRAGLRAHEEAEQAMRPWRDMEPDLMRVAHRVARGPKREETP
jgi:CRISPR type IV-associated protein Csf1